MIKLTAPIPLASRVDLRYYTSRIGIPADAYAVAGIVNRFGYPPFTIGIPAGSGNA